MRRATEPTPDFKKQVVPNPNANPNFKKDMPAHAPEMKKDLPKQVMPGQPAPGPRIGPPLNPNAPVQGVAPVAPKAPGGAAAAFKQGPGGPPIRFQDVQKARKERVEPDGRRIIEEPGNRLIVKQGDRTVIRHDETERFRHAGRDVKSERRPDGHTETFYVCPDGMRIVSHNGHKRQAGAPLAAAPTAASTTSSTIAASCAMSRSVSE